MKAAVYFTFILLSSGVLSSCKKGDGGPNGGSNSPTRPTLTTTAASVITANSAQTGGTILSDGGSPITARGVCWSSVLSGPTIADSKTVDGSGTGSFTSTLVGLTPYKAYYVRAYATNASGTGYGNEITIGTLPGLTLKINDVYVTNYVRLCETEVAINGFGAPLSLPVTGSGVCWSKSQNPTIADNKTSTGPVSSIVAHFIVSLPLSINSTYYLRAYGTNSAGTTYSNQVMHTTGVDIGLTHAGGVIFYVDNTKQHGLVAATSDQGTAIPWAPGNLFTTSTNTTSYSDGAGNTTKIIAKYGNSGTYAAKLCRDYRGGGFTDWFLPAAYQIDYMKFCQDAIGGFHGNAFLANYNYWSSSENNYFLATVYDFNPRYFSVSLSEKKNAYYVRAARAF